MSPGTSLRLFCIKERSSSVFRSSVTFDECRILPLVKVSHTCLEMVFRLIDLDSSPLCPTLVISTTLFSGITENVNKGWCQNPPSPTIIGGNFSPPPSPSLRFIGGGPEGRVFTRCLTRNFLLISRDSFCFLFPFTHTTYTNTKYTTNYSVLPLC